MFVVLGWVISARAGEPEQPSETQKELIANGTQAFNQGQYDRAVQALMHAYEIRAIPKLLYNIGQAHRMAGRRQEALAFFEKFLLEAPKDPLHAKAEAQTIEIRAELRMELRAKMKIEHNLSSNRYIAKWILGGAGLLALIAGGIVLGYNGHGDCEIKVPEGMCENHWDTKPHSAVFMTGGGILLGTSGLLLGLDYRQRQQWQRLMTLTLSIKF